MSHSFCATNTSSYHATHPTTTLRFRFMGQMSSSGMIMIMMVLLPTILASQPFLHEILVGRCYARPPTKGGEPASCPSTVGSFMGAIEGHLDQDITESSFQSYLSQADFSSPKDAAVFIMAPPAGHRSSSSLSFVMQHFVTVETTAGGAMLADLDFTGVGVTNSVPCLDSTACASFWNASYASFAFQATGHVRVVVLEDDKESSSSASMNPLFSGIAHLNTDAVSSVSIFAPRCSAQTVSNLKDVLQTSAKVKKLSCTESFSALLVCDDPESASCSCVATPASGGSDASASSHSKTSSSSSSASTSRRHDTLPEETNMNEGGGVDTTPTTKESTEDQSPTSQQHQQQLRPPNASSSPPSSVAANVAWALFGVLVATFLAVGYFVQTKKLTWKNNYDYDRVPEASHVQIQ